MKLLFLYDIKLFKSIVIFIIYKSHIFEINFPNYILNLIKKNKKQKRQFFITLNTCMTRYPAKWFQTFFLSYDLTAFLSSL